MKRSGHTKEDQAWLRELGKRIESLILKRGYSSPYDFWTNQAGDQISRAALNYILTGKTDPKITTLRILAKLLDIPLSKLIDC